MIGVKNVRHEPRRSQTEKLGHVERMECVGLLVGPETDGKDRMHRISPIRTPLHMI